MEHKSVFAKDLDDVHAKNKENQNLQRQPDEVELNDLEWMDYKISNWDNCMNCSSNDKKTIIKWLIHFVRELNKEVEELKGGQKWK